MDRTVRCWGCDPGGVLQRGQIPGAGSCPAEPGGSASLSPEQSWPRIREAAAALATGENPIRPFHWEIEFPEVFGTHDGGFDAIVGNPPFAGKNTLINSHRDAELDWLQTLHEGAHGNADLVAHFFRRAFGCRDRAAAWGWSPPTRSVRAIRAKAGWAR